MKRKNDERRVMWSVVSLVMALVFFAGVTAMVLLVETAENESVCVPVTEADFVMYGFEGIRNVRSESPALLSALSSLRMDRVGGLPDGHERLMDVGVYDEFNLVGTMLFVYTGSMQEWYVVLNDDQRRDCGVYRVDGVDLIFDALRRDE